MREQFWIYIVNLYQNIPTEVYEGLLSVYCLGLVLLLGFCGIKKGLRYSSVLLLAEYVFLLFCSTVIYRIVGEIRQYDFQPFWSYQAIQDGREDLLAENIMNVVVFIPVGLLLGVGFKQVTWWKVLLIGCGISVTIESLQFFLMRGFSELYDVMHNTMGCLIGFEINTILRIIVKIGYKNV